MGYETAMVCKPGSAMDRFCTERKLPFYTFRMKGELDFTAGLKIASLCRKRGFNVLHLHSAHAVATGLWAKLFKKSLRLIAVRRVQGPIRKNYFSRYKYTTPNLDRIVCISNAIREALLEDGLPAERLVTIHSGIDLNRFSGDVDTLTFKHRLSIPEHHALVGTVAAITPEKDYPTLIEAARRVVKRMDDVSFCAVGTGSEENAMRELAESIGLGSRFVFTGFRSDVGHFLKCFDIFVLASTREGLGTSILDAQTQGLPVVACRTGGIPEIVHDGINGCLVSPGDPVAMADAILELVSNTDLRNRMGRAAVKSVQEFSIDKTVEKNLALYRSILSGNSDGES
jgi:glycosyltransferase involved in cell wall biosynthesis